MNKHSAGLYFHVFLILISLFPHIFRSIFKKMPNICTKPNKKQLNPMLDQWNVQFFKCVWYRPQTKRHFIPSTNYFCHRLLNIERLWPNCVLFSQCDFTFLLKISFSAYACLLLLQWFFLTFDQTTRTR